MGPKKAKKAKNKENDNKDNVTMKDETIVPKKTQKAAKQPSKLSADTMEDEPDLDSATELINTYVESIHNFLNAPDLGIDVKPSVYVQTYNSIVFLCDDDNEDHSKGLYTLYQKILKKYVDKTIAPAIKAKAKDSKNFLTEYILQWKKYATFVACA